MPISIGLPFYNAEQFLVATLRSIFAQTYQDWELILVDDGSTDRSLEIARSVTDSRVRVLSDGENKKLPARLNQITAEAEHDLIGRMDADDLISPTRFDKQAAILEAHPETDLVTTGVFSVTDDLQPVGVRWHHSNSITLNELLRKRGCGIVHAAVLGRKRWFLRNPYDSSIAIAQDYELWLRSCSKGDLNIHLMQEPLYYYREEGSATAEKMLMAYRNERHMYWQYGRLRRAPLIMRSLSKSLVVQALSMIDGMETLLRRRSERIEDAAMLRRFQTEIDQISQTKIPGLD